ncbi:cytochrome P450 [Amycolatopsis sp., V23-08]|uniref:Cytochrome P450 n=1 Tax=Amycolatopsis heterodermiae TaxID=3110235 RepID=A0ABU5RGC1_9PSEU|nr:cytochrome P450 [Amycolatopsis sp., V23-08]MEA5364654.1 cytochrome P450 [Amycolatopsis sp., V23-08]
MTTVEVAEDFAQDAHLFAELLRGGGPVRRVRMPRGLGCYIVTDFAQARALLADSRLRKDSQRAHALFESKLPSGATTQGGFEDSLGRHMLNMDPPDHSRLRKLVNKAFTGRTVARLRPRIEEITAELLDALAGRERADLLPSFAAPLPITVICELLGVAAEDRTEFADWSKTLLSASEPEDAQAAAQNMFGYLTAQIAQKRAEPAEDLLSDLVHASDDGDSLSEPELLSMAFLLLVAGHETTVNLIANSVLALLRRPEQLALLRDDPSLLPNAVEEFLRFDGPIHLATLRFTVEPVEAGGVTIPEGEFVLISLLGANRDEARYAEPDKLDITRAAGGHLAFGHGIHYCVGAPLARLEAEIALGGLLARFPDITLDAKPDELVYRPSSLIHGLESLPVRLR